MKRWRRTVGVGVLGLIFTWLTGCSRQVAVPGPNTSANSQLPFERVSDKSGLSPTAGFAFDEIPAGTEVTIRLQTPLSSADARAGDSFQAVLDEPLAGKKIAPQGTPVVGNVVAARPFASPDDSGYMRLTLVSMVVNGKSVALETSSVFAKGRSLDKRKPTPIKITDPTAEAPAQADGIGSSTSRTQDDVKFSTGHRLLFRLAQPLQLSR